MARVIINVEYQGEFVGKTISSVGTGGFVVGKGVGEAVDFHFTDGTKASILLLYGGELPEGERPARTTAVAESEPAWEDWQESIKESSMHPEEEAVPR